MAHAGTGHSHSDLSPFSGFLEGSPAHCVLQGVGGGERRWGDGGKVPGKSLLRGDVQGHFSYLVSVPANGNGDVIPSFFNF